MPNPLLLITGVTKAYEAYTALSKQGGRGRGKKRKPPMKNMLALIGGAVVILGSAGWYLDWFNVGNIKTANGKQSLQLEFNSDKFKADLEKGTDKLKDTIDGLGEEQKAAPHDPALTKIKEGVKEVQNLTKDGKAKTEDQWRKSRDNFFDFGNKK